ncbi:hypothetical protein M758_8G024500 [Ceratodon purpureus]|nr:hypothetical protein M758_8G024500 [Ceratodon purpureus]
MGASALVSSLPGCVVPGYGESQQRSFSVHRSSINWVPPASLKARIKVSVSASSSSSQGEPDLRAEDGKSGSSSGEVRASDAGAGGENSSLDSLLPSRKQSTSEAEAKPKGNAAQSALERAMAYKKMKGLGASSNPTLTQPQAKPSPPVPPSNPVKVESLAGKPIQSSKSSAEPPNSDSTTSSPTVEGKEQAGKLESGKEEAGKTVALSAFERAKAYKQQQSEMVAALNDEKQAPEASSTPVVEKEENVIEIEIHTRDGIVKRKVLKPETAFANVKDIRRKGVSNMDFVGLGFADKKSTSSRPAGLSESFEAPTGPLPEVEMLTRDAGVADRDAMAEGEMDDVYKPRVTTWGMFPRPADISKAYGGGRNIKPGQKLETEEEKIARETKTKKLLDDYKKKLGLDMAPKDRARCERTMKEGEKLMDRGQLKEAQAAFLTVMDEMPFPSELHGMAALQEAVCLDSLNRSDEAKIRYEKLVSHPNGAVRKKARQLLFGFQAAEKLKVRAGYNWDSSSYRKYFDAFADGYNTMYKKGEESTDDEDSLMQTLPYALLLMFPVILLFTLVALKNA